MKLFKIILSAVSVALWLSVAWADPVIFSHPYDPNSTTAYSSWWTDENGPLHQSFADYYWDGVNTITDFHWWGAPGDPQPQVSAFTFEIWSNNTSENKPGSLLYTELIAGNAGQTFVGNNPNYDLDVYSYSFNLATPFQPASVDDYWFSVAAHSSSNWYWALGNGTAFNSDWTHAYIPLYPDDSWLHPSEGDFAFEITGSSTTIPEPATLMLLGSGLLGMGGLSAFRFRRKK